MKESKDSRFRYEDTENFFYGERIPYLEKIEKVGRKKLNMLLACPSWKEVKKVAANLHKLKGKRRGQWASDVNDQYRICFVWENNRVQKTEITDYHDE